MSFLKEFFALGIGMVPGLPLLAGIIIGLSCRKIPKSFAHSLAILFVALSFIISGSLLYFDMLMPAGAKSVSVYPWGMINGVSLEVGFLIDRLSLLMMLVVTFISLMVHIYSIGYMRGDPGYQRFFSYISLFTFGMLMLVMSNNFLQLFFGWEMVGLMSYLLIGFWFQREAANRASLKAFLINRVGDLGFLIGIASVLHFFGSLDYTTVFQQVSTVAGVEISMPWSGGEGEISAITFTCLCLFIGAMGKSAQMPLHVWLPDSMEGPTPISALIHAATMVTAGVFMLARISPLLEHSGVAREVILGIGVLTALLTGLLAIVQSDIKRIIAYSTLSQLGYMIAAMGASAYAIGIFHLMTHAFFKALLFLGAGSVIIALHHEQNIWRMGGLHRKMPITYITLFIASLSMIGIPGLSGFYSKDLILEAISHSTLQGRTAAYLILLSTVVITALYSFRLMFVVFYGGKRYHEEKNHPVHESPYVITIPLILLAIPSILIGAYFVERLFSGFFDNTLWAGMSSDTMLRLTQAFQGPFEMLMHGLVSLPTWLALLGVLMAWVGYIARPELPNTLKQQFHSVYNLLREKYGFDRFYEFIANRTVNSLAWVCWRIGDERLIDGMMVNGLANTIGKLSHRLRHLQTGYLYHYAFSMIAGFIILVGWVLWGASD